MKKTSKQKTAKTARAFSYIRFSSPEQLKGDSLRRQLESSSAYAKKHNLILDDSLQLRDLGISAFKGRNVKDGALAAFLEAISRGKVASGSVLIVESLDRISRDEIGEALTLFMSILNKGIEIATIEPERRYTRRSINDVAGILEAIIYMARAHEESAIKSQRLTRAWEAKRHNVGSAKLTKSCPAWLSLSADRKRFLPITARARIVKRIFEYAASGWGVRSIARRFHAEGLAPIGRAGCWHKSYVLKILKNRAVLGEYQPHSGHAGTERKPLGDPVPDYYPRIVSNQLWYQAQRALTARQNQRGPIGNQVSNLFTGLVRDARDGATMTFVNKGQKSSGPQLVSSAAQRGERGSRYASFPYRAFETAMLRFTREISPADLFPPASGGTQLREQLDATEGELGVVDEKLDKCKKRLLADGDFEALVEVLKALEEQRQRLYGQAERLRSELHATRYDELPRTQELLEALESVSGEELTHLRLKLRSKLRSLMSEIWMLVLVKGTQRTVLVQVHLAGGGYRKLKVTVRRESEQVWFEGQEELASDAVLGVDLRNYRSGRAVPASWA